MAPAAAATRQLFLTNLGKNVLDLGTVIIKDTHVLREFQLVSTSAKRLRIVFQLSSAFPAGFVQFQKRNENIEVLRTNVEHAPDADACVVGAFQEDWFNQIFNEINTVTSVVLQPMGTMSLVASFRPMVASAKNPNAARFHSIKSSVLMIAFDDEHPTVNPLETLDLRLRGRMCRSRMDVNVKEVAFGLCPQVGRVYVRTFSVRNRCELPLRFRLGQSWAATKVLSCLDYETGEEIYERVLGAFSQLTIRVSFEPQVAGEFEHLLSLLNRNDVSDTQEVLLTALVDASESSSQQALLSLSSARLDFGDCYTGIPVYRQLNVYSEAKDELQIKLSSDIGHEEISFEDEAGQRLKTFSLLPGLEQLVRVVFCPKRESEGRDEGGAHVLSQSRFFVFLRVHDCSGKGLRRMEVRGVSRVCSSVVEVVGGRNKLDMGQVTVGKATTGNLTLYNTSDLPASIEFQYRSKVIICKPRRVLIPGKSKYTVSVVIVPRKVNPHYVRDIRMINLTNPDNTVAISVVANCVREPHVVQHEAAYGLSIPLDRKYVSFGTCMTGVPSVNYIDFTNKSPDTPLRMMLTSSSAEVVLLTQKSKQEIDSETQQLQQQQQQEPQRLSDDAGTTAGAPLLRTMSDLQSSNSAMHDALLLEAAAAASAAAMRTAPSSPSLSRHRSNTVHDYSSRSSTISTGAPQVEQQQSVESKESEKDRALMQMFFHRFDQLASEFLGDHVASVDVASEYVAHVQELKRMMKGDRVFRKVNGCELVLGPNHHETTVRVYAVFVPEGGEGTRFVGSLTVSVDSLSQDRQIPMNAIVQPYRLAPAQSNFNFGTVAQYEPLRRQLILNNLGACPAAYEVKAASGGGGKFAHTVSFPSNKNKGVCDRFWSVQIPILIKPDAAGMFSQDLEIENQLDPTRHKSVVHLKARVVRPILFRSKPSSVKFETLHAGGTSERKIITVVNLSKTPQTFLVVSPENAVFNRSVAEYTFHVDASSVRKALSEEEEQVADDLRRQIRIARRKSQPKKLKKLEKKLNKLVTRGKRHAAGAAAGAVGGGTSTASGSGVSDGCESSLTADEGVSGAGSSGSVQLRVPSRSQIDVVLQISVRRLYVAGGQEMSGSPRITSSSARDMTTASPNFADVTVGSPSSPSRSVTSAAADSSMMYGPVMNNTRSPAASGDGGGVAGRDDAAAESISGTIFVKRLLAGKGQEIVSAIPVMTDVLYRGVTRLPSRRLQQQRPVEQQRQGEEEEGFLLEPGLIEVSDSEPDALIQETLTVVELGAGAMAAATDEALLDMFEVITFPNDANVVQCELIGSCSAHPPLQCRTAIRAEASKRVQRVGVLLRRKSDGKTARSLFVIRPRPAACLRIPESVDLGYCYIVPGRRFAKVFPLTIQNAADHAIRVLAKTTIGDQVFLFHDSALSSKLWLEELTLEVEASTQVWIAVRPRLGEQELCRQLQCGLTFLMRRAHSSSEHDEEVENELLGGGWTQQQQLECCEQTIALSCVVGRSTLQLLPESQDWGRVSMGEACACAIRVKNLTDLMPTQFRLEMPVGGDRFVPRVSSNVVTLLDGAKQRQIGGLERRSEVLVNLKARTNEPGWYQGVLQAINLMNTSELCCMKLSIFVDSNLFELQSPQFNVGRIYVGSRQDDSEDDEQLRGETSVVTQDVSLLCVKDLRLIQHNTVAIVPYSDLDANVEYQRLGGGLVTSSDSNKGLLGMSRRYSSPLISAYATPKASAAAAPNSINVNGETFHRCGGEFPVMTSIQEGAFVQLKSVPVGVSSIKGRLLFVSQDPKVPSLNRAVVQMVPIMGTVCCSEVRCVKSVGLRGTKKPKKKKGVNKTHRDQDDDDDDDDDHHREQADLDKVLTGGSGGNDDSGDNDEDDDDDDDDHRRDDDDGDGGNSYGDGKKGDEAEGGSSSSKGGNDRNTTGGEVDGDGEEDEEEEEEDILDLGSIGRAFGGLAVGIADKRFAIGVEHVPTASSDVPFQLEALDVPEFLCMEPHKLNVPEVVFRFIPDKMAQLVESGLQAVVCVVRLVNRFNPTNVCQKRIRFVLKPSIMRLFSNISELGALTLPPLTHSPLPGLEASDVSNWFSVENLTSRELEIPIKLKTVNNAVQMQLLAVGVGGQRTPLPQVLVLKAREMATITVHVASKPEVLLTDALMGEAEFGRILFGDLDDFGDVVQVCGRIVPGPVFALSSMRLRVAREAHFEVRNLSSEYPICVNIDLPETAASWSLSSSQAVHLEPSVLHLGPGTVSQVHVHAKEPWQGSVMLRETDFPNERYQQLEIVAESENKGGGGPGGVGAGASGDDDDFEMRGSESEDSDAEDDDSARRYAPEDEEEESDDDDDNYYDRKLEPEEAAAAAAAAAAAEEDDDGGDCGEYDEERLQVLGPGPKVVAPTIAAATENDDDHQRVLKLFRDSADSAFVLQDDVPSAVTSPLPSATPGIASSLFVRGATRAPGSTHRFTVDFGRQAVGSGEYEWEISLSNAWMAGSVQYEVFSLSERVRVSRREGLLQEYGESQTFVITVDADEVLSLRTHVVIQNLTQPKSSKFLRIKFDVVELEQDQADASPLFNVFIDREERVLGGGGRRSESSEHTELDLGEIVFDETYSDRYFLVRNLSRQAQSFQFQLTQHQDDELLPLEEPQQHGVQFSVSRHRLEAFDKLQVPALSNQKVYVFAHFKRSMQPYYTEEEDSEGSTIRVNAQVSCRLSGNANVHRLSIVARCFWKSLSINQRVFRFTALDQLQQLCLSSFIHDRPVEYLLNCSLLRTFSVEGSERAAITGREIIHSVEVSVALPPPEEVVFVEESFTVYSLRRLCESYRVTLVLDLARNTNERDDPRAQLPSAHSIQFAMVSSVRIIERNISRFLRRFLERVREDPADVFISLFMLTDDLVYLAQRFRLAPRIFESARLLFGVVQRVDAGQHAAQVQELFDRFKRSFPRHMTDAQA